MAQAPSTASSTSLFSLALAGSFLLASITQAGTLDSAKSAAAAFLAENDAAMATMMDAMTIKPSGNVDKDFAAMMIPHHQGAIEMARAELRHGHNETLRRIAQEIVVEQQQEIAAMQLALGQSLQPSLSSPTHPAPVAASDVSGGPQPAGTATTPLAIPMKLESTP